MSYILDALKRADSERERGAVPGLRTQTGFAGPTPMGRPPTHSFTYLLLAGSGLVLIGLGWWLWQSPNPNRPKPSDAAAAQVLTSPNLPPPLVSSSVLVDAKETRPAPVISADQVAAMKLPTPVREADVMVSKATQARAPEPELSKKLAPALPARPVIFPRAEAGGLGKQTESLTSPGNDQRIASMSELPADIRLALPKLVISGSTYSDNPVYRMLIINGQVFHEGEKPVADLQLEQIRPKTAVLNFKGNRYSMAY